MRSSIGAVSVPNTYSSALATSRCAARRLESARLRCRCGSLVRNGFLMCQSCEDAELQNLPGLTRSQAIAIVRRSTACECGRPRSRKSDACPECTWQDGTCVDLPYISYLRTHDGATISDLAHVSGRNRKLVEVDLARLSRCGRLMRTTTELDGREVIWYSLS